MTNESARPSFRISGATVHTGADTPRGATLAVADGRVSDVAGPRKGDMPEYELPVTWSVVPGFIDTHIHGAAGVDVMDATPQALGALARYLPGEGTTSFLATTMSAGDKELAEVAGNVGAYTSGRGEAEILGIHLEGPFIAAAKAGAQGERWLREPDAGVFDEWQRRSGERIRLVTLAPECPGALALVERLVARGVEVSIGHTNCTAAQAEAAIAAGCRRITHLFNAMSGLHHREPGAACAGLLSPQARAEIIADGVHVAPAMLRLAYRMKGLDGLMLVTDSIRGKGCGDGNFDLGGEMAHVRGGVARRDNGVLAGSVLRMDQGLRNVLDVLGCGLSDAVRMASVNPAASIGVLERKGTLEPGKDADIVVLDEQLRVRMSFCRGEKAFDAGEP